MTIVPLETYLRTYRKRTGLSHEEVAFLCGNFSGASVTRHEAGDRHPKLRTAIMYEIIMRAPIRDLYEGVFRDAVAVVHERARGLYKSLERQTQSDTRDLKIRHLMTLLDELAELIT